MSRPGGRNEEVRSTLCHIVVPGDDCCSGVCERAKGTDSFIVLYKLFAVITWKYIGFGIVLFLAGLQGIPIELREVALIYGGNGWQVTRSITVPFDPVRIMTSEGRHMPQQRWSPT